MRTYYLTAEAIYPLPKDCIDCRTYPSQDAVTRSLEHIVRASSRKEAVDLLWRRLNDERETACREQLA